MQILKHLFLSSIFCSSIFAGDLKISYPSESAESKIVLISPNQEVSVTLPKMYKYTFSAVKVKISAVNDKSFAWEDGKFYTSEQPKNVVWNGYDFKPDTKRTLAPVVGGNLTVKVNGTALLDVQNIISSNGAVIDTGDLNFGLDTWILKSDNVIVSVLINGDVTNLDGYIILIGAAQKEREVRGEIISDKAYFNQEYPVFSWRIIDDNGFSIGKPSSYVLEGQEVGSYTDGIPFNGNQNKGMGNNLDGIDADNPGKGKGGPVGLKNLGLDTLNADGTDDEILNKLKNGR